MSTQPTTHFYPYGLIAPSTQTPDQHDYQRALTIAARNALLLQCETPALSHAYQRMLQALEQRGAVKGRLTAVDLRYRSNDYHNAIHHLADALRLRAQAPSEETEGDCLAYYKLLEDAYRAFHAPLKRFDIPKPQDFSSQRLFVSALHAVRQKMDELRDHPGADLSGYQASAGEPRRPVTPQHDPAPTLESAALPKHQNPMDRQSALKRIGQELTGLPCPDDRDADGRGWYERLEAVAVAEVDELDELRTQGHESAATNDYLLSQSKAVRESGHAVTRILHAWAEAILDYGVEDQRTRTMADSMIMAINALYQQLPSPARDHVVNGERFKEMVPMLHLFAQDFAKTQRPETPVGSSLHTPETQVIATTAGTTRLAASPSAVEQAIRTVKSPVASLAWYEALKGCINAYAFQCRQEADALPGAAGGFLAEIDALRQAERDFEAQLERYAKRLDRFCPNATMVDQAHYHLTLSYHQLYEALRESNEPVLYAPDTFLELRDAMEHAARAAWTPPHAGDVTGRSGPQNGSGSRNR